MHAATLPTRRVVLLGAGHTNAHVLRMWKMHPPEDAGLTCISNFPVATYSGMLPGTLAGLYPPERMTIDLVRLCAATDCRLIVGQATGLDVPQRQILFADRAPLPFDILSIGIGSVPACVQTVRDNPTVLPIKPMQTILGRLERFIESWRERKGSLDDGSTAFRMCVVGGGVAGTEIAMCVGVQLARMLKDVAGHVTIVERTAQICEGLPDSARRRVERELDKRGVVVATNQNVVDVQEGNVLMDDGTSIAADLVLWATGAAAPPFLNQLDLPKDEHGFLLTDMSLRTTSGAPIFAVGDTGSMQQTNGTPLNLPKAGVYAVRQGPILWRNIRRFLDGKPLIDYRPQGNFLRLLATGDNRAILAYKGWSAHAKWCWKLKDFIDGRFMDKHQDYSPMPMDLGRENAQNSRSGKATAAMRCTGCGGKVGSATLTKVLDRLSIEQRKHVRIGLDHPDDVAVLVRSAGDTLVTIDFFAAPLPDAHLVGRIAVLNALSDVYASGGKPHSALAHITIPVGDATAQEELLAELLLGSVGELESHRVALVGGHTIEGPRLTVGFTVLGDAAQQSSFTRATLRPGDRLVLTKPLGTGILLAAYMQARLKAEWFAPMLDCMLISNRAVAEMLSQLDVAGVTDVTGFGLAGHLREMLVASDVAAEIDLNAVPLLPGVAKLIAEGIESTLAPANRVAECDVTVSSEAVRRSPAYAALFDPQTSGGLLLGVSDQQANDFCMDKGRAQKTPPTIIGRIVEPRANEPRMRIVDDTSGA